MGELAVGDAELARRRGHGDRLDAALRRLAEIAEMPGRAEQAAMARIDARHGRRARCRGLGVYGRAVGIEAVADMGRDRCDRARSPMKRPGRADDVADRFQRLHHRAVVGGMHQRRRSRGSTKSKVPCGGRLRLSSVKFDSMPPPIATPGKAFRAAAAISLQGRDACGERRARRIGFEVEWPASTSTAAGFSFAARTASATARDLRLRPCPCPGMMISSTTRRRSAVASRAIVRRAASASLWREIDAAVEVLEPGQRLDRSPPERRRRPPAARSARRSGIRPPGPPSFDGDRCRRPWPALRQRAGKGQRDGMADLLAGRRWCRARAATAAGNRS